MERERQQNHRTLSADDRVTQQILDKVQQLGLAAARGRQQHGAAAAAVRGGRACWQKTMTKCGWTLSRGGGGIVA